MAERIIVQLQHANSAVVLTTIKVLLYLMNYMENRRLIDYSCKKMGPPLGLLSRHFCVYILTRSQLPYYLPDLKFNTLPSEIFF